MSGDDKIIEYGAYDEIREKIKIAKRTHDGDVFYTFVLQPLFYKLRLKKK